MFGSQRTLGWLISGIGALLAVLAFLLLPYLTTAHVMGRHVELTTRTAAQLALAGNGICWLGGLLTVLVLACIGWQRFRSRTAKDASKLQTTILLLMVSALLVVGSLLLYRSSSVTLVSHTFIRNPADNAPTFTCASTTSSLGSAHPTAVSTTTVAMCMEAALSIDYGPGFWVYVVGMMLVLVGSLEQIRTFRTVKAPTPS